MARLSLGRAAGAAALALLAACSEPVEAPVQMFLPDSAELPYRITQDCGCVRDRQCALLEERPGVSEIRGLGCRWLRPRAAAECRFEERFTGHFAAADGSRIETPGPWISRSLTAILLPDGRWCAA